MLEMPKSKAPLSLSRIEQRASMLPITVLIAASTMYAAAPSGSITNRKQ